MNNKCITVKDLLHQLAALVDAGWWDLKIVIPSDDEINSIHWMWNWIITFKEKELKDLDWNKDIPDLLISYDNCVLLW